MKIPEQDLQNWIPFGSEEDDRKGVLPAPQAFIALSQAGLGCDQNPERHVDRNNITRFREVEPAGWAKWLNDQAYDPYGLAAGQLADKDKTAYLDQKREVERDPTERPSKSKGKSRARAR